MANWPRVDANTVGEAPAWARLNRAVGFTYEPGSTFKSITVAGALLENRSVRPRHRLRGRPADPGRRPRRSRRRTGRAASSRCPTSWRAPRTSARCKIGLRLGERRFDSWVEQVRLRRPDRPAAARRVAGHRAAATRTTPASSIGNLPIGQGIAVTPMQMMRRLRGDRQRRQVGQAAPDRWTSDAGDAASA